MSDDFILIENGSSGYPLIEIPSFQLLKTEWNAVKVDITELTQNTQPIWGKLFSLFSKLMIMNVEECQLFITYISNDITSLLNDPKYQNSLYLIFQFFIDLLNLYGVPITSYQDLSAVKILSILPEFAEESYKFNQKFLQNALEPLWLDEYVDKKNCYPFLDYLLSTSLMESPLANYSREIIEQIIQTQRDSVSYLIDHFPDVFASVFKLFDDSSRIINPDSHIAKIIHWISHCLCLIPPDSQDLIVSAISFSIFVPLCTVTPKKQKNKSARCLHSLVLFFTQICNTKLLTSLIDKIISTDPQSFFKVYFRDWSENYEEFEYLLKLLSLFLSTHCGAIINAFFSYSEFDESSNRKIHGFTNIPALQKTNAEDEIAKNLANYYYPNFSNISPDLPTSSPYIMTVFEFIEDQFRIALETSNDIIDLLFDIIFKIASINTNMSKMFCFTPGQHIYALTAKYLSELSNSKEKPLFAKKLRSFTITMNHIYALQNPEQHPL